MASCHEYGVANESVKRGPVMSLYVVELVPGGKVSSSIDASWEERSKRS